jgi:hypothetical protein
MIISVKVFAALTVDKSLKIRLFIAISEGLLTEIFLILTIILTNHFRNLPI